MQFKPLPEKRAVPAFVKKVPAQTVVLELMKTGAAERSTLRQEIEAERKRADSLATAFALQVYRKRGSDDPFVHMLSDLMAEYKVEAVTYEGEPLTPELETAADIVEWLPAGDNDAECVVEAIEPEIRFQGRILHRAKLSCRKAPEPEPEITAEPEQAVASESAAAEEAAKEPTAEAANGSLEPADAAAEERPVEPAAAAGPQTAPEREKPGRKARFMAIIGKLFSKWKKPGNPEAQATMEDTATKADDTDNENEGSDRT